MAKKQAKKQDDELLENEKHEGDESESEDEGKHEDESENETESEDEGEGTGSDGDHDDKDQDVALIKKMIGEYVGDGSKSLSKEETEALHSLGKEAYQAHQDMGKKEDEAYKCAGEAVKLAHHMASKKKSEAETEESEDEGDMPPPKKKTKPAPKAGHDDGDDDDDGNSSESEAEKKESRREKTLKKQLLETQGRLAALEAKDKQRELGRYVEAQLKKSGQKVEITKKFREAAGKFKSKTDFDAKWSMFLEGVKQTQSKDADTWGVMMERATSDEDGARSSEGSSATDFSDCAGDF